jgi:hypothetical protein
MTPEQALRDWLVTLSDMLEGELTESSSLEEGMEWFAGLPDSQLESLQGLSPAVNEFIEMGPALMKAVSG